MTYTEAMIALADMLSCGSDDPRLRVVANEMGNLGARLAESEAEVERTVLTLSVEYQQNARLLARALAAEAERDDLLGALRPFARFEIPQQYRREGYRGTVYATQVVPGQDATELTVDDFDRARAAIAKVGGPARPEMGRGKCGPGHREWGSEPCPRCGGTGREGTK